MDGRIQAADRILIIRTLVARAGEKDNLAWWDSDALSEAGSYVLRRLFPRSAARAGVRLAIEAATIRHRTVLGEQKVLSLFCLGEPWDSLVDGRIERRYGGPNLPRVPESLQWASDLAAALKEGGLLTDSDWEAPESLELFESNTLEIGQVRDAHGLLPEEINRLASRLAVSYARGEKGRLVVPYLRIL